MLLLLDLIASCSHPGYIPLYMARFKAVSMFVLLRAGNAVEKSESLSLGMQHMWQLPCHAAHSQHKSQTNSETVQT